jgi:hypothetical protein
MHMLPQLSRITGIPLCIPADAARPTPAGYKQFAFYERADDGHDYSDSEYSDEDMEEDEDGNERRGPEMDDRSYRRESRKHEAVIVLRRDSGWAFSQEALLVVSPLLFLAGLRALSSVAGHFCAERIGFGVVAFSQLPLLSTRTLQALLFPVSDSEPF